MNATYKKNRSRLKVPRFHDLKERFLDTHLWKILNSRSLKITAIIILLAIVSFVAYRFIQKQQSELEQINFSANLQEGLSENDREVEYNPENVFTLLVLMESENDDKPILEGFSLVRLDRDSHQADVISIHPDIYIPLQSLYGRSMTPLDLEIARLRDLMVVGELQNPPIPLAYTLYQLEELLAVPIDGYVLFPSSQHDQIGAFSTGSIPWDDLEERSGFEEWTREWEDYWIEYLRSISLVKVWMNRSDLPDIESNMSPMEMYAFSQEMSALSDEEIHRLVPDEDMLSETMDERGKVVKIVSIQSADELLSSLGRDNQMDREQARIEILNGTNVNGLGSRYERWITHVGGEVIRVKNAPGKQQETIIYVTDSEKYEYTLEQISALWDSVKVVEGRPDYITTGDIIIVLGMDF